MSRDDENNESIKIMSTIRKGKCNDGKNECTTHPRVDEYLLTLSSYGETDLPLKNPHHEQAGSSTRYLLLV